VQVYTGGCCSGPHRIVYKRYTTLRATLLVKRPVLISLQPKAKQLSTFKGPFAGLLRSPSHSPRPHPFRARPHRVRAPLANLPRLQLFLALPLHQVGWVRVVADAYILNLQCLLGSLADRLSNAMGGAFSKKGSKRDKDPRTQDKQNRRLSVSGIAQGPQGDSNTVCSASILCDALQKNNFTRLADRHGNRQGSERIPTFLSFVKCWIRAGWP
jgi:hypothetical protein